MPRILPAVAFLATALTACAPLTRFMPDPDDGDPSPAEPPAAEPRAASSGRTTPAPAPASAPGPGHDGAADRTAATDRAADPAPAEPVPVVPETDFEILRAYEAGMAAQRAGQFDVALRHWVRVHEASPGFEGVDELLLKEYLVRGLESFSRGALDDAIGSWELAQAIRPDDVRVNAYLKRAREQRERQSPAE